MHRSLLSVVLSVSVLLSTLVAAQDASYTFTPIDVPGSFITVARGINKQGQIVGWFNDGTGQYGFLKDGDTFTPIDVPGSALTEAFGINTAGQIVGYFDDGTGRAHGFVTDGDTFTTVDVPGSTNTLAYGINDFGQIVGNFDDPTTGRRRGFVTDGVTFTTFDVPGAIITEARGINTAGQIVGNFIDATGQYGFLKDGDTFTTTDVPGARYTNPSGINESGQIVGYFIDADAAAQHHGFVTDGVALSPIDVPGAAHTEVFGINTAGQIVGLFYDAITQHGFLATPVDPTPPVITVSASPATLSPPNERLVTVTVSGTITDKLGGSGVKPNSAAYTVIDEYGQIQPSGSLTLGADGSYAFTVALQASRRGNDRDGRQYTIVVSAADMARNLGSKSIIVTVPRN